MIDLTPHYFRGESGVYLIVNLVTQKVYVGSTKCFCQRARSYRYSLKSGCSQKKLALSYQKHGPKSFVFIPVVMCSLRALPMLEQFYIDLFNAVDEGYNTLREAYGRRSDEFSSEHKQRLSDSNRRRKGRLKFSDSARANMSEAMAGHKNPRCKLTPDQVLEIKDLIGTMPGVRIAERYGISESTVSHIKTGRKWA